MKDLLNPRFIAETPNSLPENLPSADVVFRPPFTSHTKDYPLHKTVIDLFEQQAQLRPQAIALTFRDQEFTYEQLNAYANQLAHLLISKGVKEESLVPICIEKCPQMIIGVLGILKAGAAYVPIDPDYPADRIGFVIEDTAASLAISSQSSKSSLPQPQLSIVELNEDLSAIAGQPAANCEARTAPCRLAYVIYTSGSTGKPKGVMIEHRGLVNLSYAQAEEFGLQPGMRTLQFASFGFDASCSELFVTFLSGGCLVLPQKEDLLSAESFAQIAEKHKIDVVTLPPSYQIVVKDSLGTIKTLVSAGEPLNESTGRYLQAKGIRVFNAYGPTENTVCVTMSDNPIKDDHTIVIGTPLANVSVYIVDAGGNRCSPGTAGEICVGGVQVARGYLNRAALTAEKFVTDPFSAEPDARMYRTGDLGRWLPDGNIEFMGRLDDQVKIRGYRIEPGEIENVLHQCEWVREAVVLAKTGADGNKRLVAYVAANGYYNKKAIIGFLKEKLPDYMVPALWVQMQNFPLTPNGKIDKKALPEPDMNDALQGFVPPRTEAEQKLVQIWQKLFGIKQLGICDNFFELGGNSILAIQVVSQAKRAGYRILPADFFIHQTIEQLAGVVQQRLSNGNATPHTKTENSKAQSGIAVVPFQTEGSNMPFFFMSPGFSVYDKVLYSLGKDQPFYFFVPCAYTSVEEIARFYIQEMKKIKPAGPYCLGGYCGFGEVALEMAQQLKAAGEEVALLALFEFYYPTAIKPVNYNERLKYYYGELRSVSLSDKAMLLYSFVKRKLRKVKRRTTKAIEKTFNNLPETTGYLIGENRYTAKPYDGAVLLFRSSQRTARISDDAYMGWKDYFTGKVELHTIDGDHKTMFHEKGAAQIAHKLKAASLVPAGI